MKQKLKYSVMDDVENTTPSAQSKDSSLLLTFRLFRRAAMSMPSITTASANL